MPVCRFIFRVDFTYNFDLVDRPGSAMRLLRSRVPEDYWSEYSENQRNRGVSAAFVSSGSEVSRALTIEPANINGNVESAEGIRSDDLLEDDAFKNLTGIATDVCNEFGVDSITRSGLRVIYLAKVGETEKATVEAYRNLIDHGMTSVVEDNLGKITDYGINFDGMSEDGVHYHARSGPFESDESDRYFKDVRASLLSDAGYNFICDLDLYERNVALSKISLDRWYQPIADKADSLLRALEKHIYQRAGNGHANGR